MRRLTGIADFFHFKKLSLSAVLFLISLSVSANTINSNNNNYLNNQNTSKYHLINHRELDNQQLTGYTGRYPILAKSMLAEDSIFSMVAMQYFRAVLFEHQIIFTAKQLKQMQMDMAEGYLEFLEGKFKQGNSTIDGDINFKEISQLHKKVYAKYKIPLEAWILKPIFDELSENEKEEYWLKILDSTGSMHKEFTFSHLIMTKMIEKLKHTPASKQENLYKVLRRISHTTVFSKFSIVAREFIIASMENMENKRK
ncbi:hypothetical protein [Providencia stuartii]|uniref:hypothetical protein n=1 Tax=Providencia stuartii TaxID=588 RepID=UPI00111FC6DF|nr:hypothetical protein [Providencia stuartii]